MTPQKYHITGELEPGLLIGFPVIASDDAGLAGAILLKRVETVFSIERVGPTIDFRALAGRTTRDKYDAWKARREVLGRGR